MSELKLYLTVVLCRPKGKPEHRLDVTCLSTGSERAARRAQWTIIATKQHGDVDEVIWESVKEVACQWFARCTNTATGYMDGGPLGDVPICDRCKEKVERLKS